MNTLKLLLILIVGLNTVNLMAQTTDTIIVPDSNFRDFLIRQSYGSAGAGTSEVVITDITNITYIDIQYNNISDLTGIEHFTGLTTLDCRNNNLTTLDVSKNTVLWALYCSDNKLNTLDVSKNKTLEHLRCNNNRLTALDISGSIALRTLWCYENRLTTLDVSKNTVMDEIKCSENNLITLDVSKNTALEELKCSENNLTALDVSKNVALKELSCFENNLTILDVSKNTNLTDLSCGRNNLSTLDVSKNMLLKALWLDGNSLTSLDATKNTALERLDCRNNNLINLDVSKNIYLTYFDSNPNDYLTSIGVSQTQDTDNINTGFQAPSSWYKPSTVVYYIVDGTDPNNAPTNITLSSSSSDENVAVGTVIGQLSTIDSDNGDTHTYSLGGVDASSFSLDGNILKWAISPDFETKSSHSIAITTRDQDGAEYSKNFTIIVANVDENTGNDTLYGTGKVGNRLTFAKGIKSITPSNEAVVQANKVFFTKVGTYSVIDNEDQTYVLTIK